MARHLRFLLLLAALSLFVGGCATPAGPSPAASAREAADQRARTAQNLAVFNTVWELVARKHYDPKLRGLDWDEAARIYRDRVAGARDARERYEALNAMLAGLSDSHTRALTPTQARERKTRERARHGFSMAQVEGRWVVVDVSPDSPAGAAGVLPGWLVLSRNGQPLDTLRELRPREGEDVRWEFLDAQDQVIAATLKARPLSIAPLQVERELPGGYVYLRFDEFDRKDRRWLGRMLEKHRSAPGVVIDLRRNAGGGTFSLGVTLGEFFDKTTDCGTFISRAGARKVKKSWQLGSARYRGKVAVLIDTGSASAAEIFAAVLQEHGRATLVGRKTAGAVLASWFYRLPDGGLLQLSREDYVTPKGRRIEAVGVEPDLSVTRSLAELRRGHDADLAAALTALAERN